FVLLDEIGPRLVGTLQMEQARDCAVDKFNSWGITAENQQFGAWRRWDRGTTHSGLIEPSIESLEGMQLQWTPTSPNNGITAQVITLPQTIKDSVSFAQRLPQAKGKIVLVSMPQITGRPDYNWEEFAKEGSFEKMKEERKAITE